MEKEFNQLEYIKAYDKNHYSKFSAKLKKEELEEINQFLKENNMNKREFILKAYKILELKIEVKKIISKYHCSTEFPKVVNLGNLTEKKLNNGINISLYTLPVLGVEKMLVIKIEFEDNILYFGTANFRFSNIMIKELEKINISS